MRNGNGKTVSGVGKQRLTQGHVIGLWLRGLRVQSPSLTPDSGNTAQVPDITVARLKRELRLQLASARLDRPRLVAALAQFLAVAS